MPSVAIREGVLNTIELTKEHFQSLYGGVPLDSWVYDSAQVSKLRRFSASNQMQLMVMNIQTFDKGSAIQCGEKHFKAVGFKEEEYDWVASAKEV